MTGVKKEKIDSFNEVLEVIAVNTDYFFGLIKTTESVPTYEDSAKSSLPK